METTSDFMGKNNTDTENMSSLSQGVIEIDKEKEQKGALRLSAQKRGRNG